MPENRMAVADELERRFADERHSFANLATFTKAVLPTILSALRDAGTGRDSGEAEANRYVAGRTDMREDAANAVVQMARTRRPSNDDDLSCAALYEAALMIRALPLQTGSDGHE